MRNLGRKGVFIKLPSSSKPEEQEHSLGITVGVGVAALETLASALGAAGREATDDADTAIARWSEPRELALGGVDRLLKEDLAAAGMLDLAMLSVATAEVWTLV